MPRKAKEIVDIKSIARTHTEMCVRTLASIAAQPKAPASARAFAANSLLDRGWGKAPQQHTGSDGGDIHVIIRQIIDITGERAAEPVLIEHGNGEDCDT
jgi:hypothetical protein